MGFIEIHVTFENKKEAEKICEYLLNERLVACVNFFGCDSMYWWKNRIENEKEVIGILKTRSENWEKTRNEIKKMHSYDVPAIIKHEIDANDEYEKWIMEETK